MTLSKGLGSPQDRKISAEGFRGGVTQAGLVKMGDMPISSRQPSKLGSGVHKSTEVGRLYDVLSQSESLNGADIRLGLRTTVVGSRVLLKCSKKVRDLEIT